MGIHLIVFSIFFALLMTFGLLPKVMQIAYEKNLFDQPETRKIHTTPIPRLGGISFLPIIIFTFLFTQIVYSTFNSDSGNILFPQSEFNLFLIGFLLIYLIGVEDDLNGVRYRKKFLFQFAAASFLPLSGLWIQNFHGLFGIYVLPAIVGIPFTILFTVFLINAINLIDGADGLASIVCIFSLTLFGILFSSNGIWSMAILSFTAVGVLLPFYYFNVFGTSEQKNKIFMGDTGSLSLGYLLAFLFLHFVAAEPGLSVYSEEIVVLAFSTLIIPVFDAIRVMMVRAINGKGLFSPDRTHIHHLLLEMGYSSRKIRLHLLIITITFCILNMFLIQHININILLCTDTLLGGIFLVWMNREKNIINNRNLSIRLSIDEESKRA